MPQEKLICDQLITLMKKKGRSNCEIARTLDVSEGTVRYRLKRMGKPDLRKQRPSDLDRYRELIVTWTKLTGEESELTARPPLRHLYFHLRDSHGYSGSYDSVCHYLRRHFPDYWSRKPFIRIETPPGALMAVDWKESVPIYFGNAKNCVRVNFLLFQLSFSRKCVLLVFDNRGLDSFLAGHMEAFERFGGVTEMIRSDCLKSAVIKYNGRESILNDSYSRFLNELDIKAFPARPRTARDKGKVERQIRSIMDRVFFHKKVFADLADLQRTIDLALMELESEQRCGSTGLSVPESFKYELKHLKPLKKISFEYPLQERLATVKRDGTVQFCNNSYQLERRFVGRSVYCVQTRLFIKIYSDNEVIAEHPYLPKSRGMVVLSEKALSDPAVHISSWTREKALEVARRQVDIYEQICNGGY